MHMLAHKAILSHLFHWIVNVLSVSTQDFGTTRVSHRHLVQKCANKNTKCRSCKEATADLFMSAGISRLFLTLTVSTFSRLFGCCFVFCTLHSTPHADSYSHTKFMAHLRVHVCVFLAVWQLFRMCDAGMLLPLTHLMICLTLFLRTAQQGNPTQSVLLQQ